MAAENNDTILTHSNFEEVVLLNGELVKRAKLRDELDQNTKKALDTVVPAAVEALVKYGRVDATQADAVNQLLRDPVKTVEFVRKLAMSAHEGEPDGVPVTPANGAVRKKANVTPPVDEKATALDRLMEQSRSWA
jgi:hypothetical protein